MTPKTDAACAFLMKSLREGRVASTDLFEAAMKGGISLVTLRRAKRLTGVFTVKTGFGTESTHHWHLPNTSPAPQRPGDAAP